MVLSGNTTAIIQVKGAGAKNAIGEREHQWIDVGSFNGWCDLSSGDAKHTNFNAKIQESSHTFICDYQSFKNACKIDVTSENARILIDKSIYQIMLIDDPMGMHQHLEIYLKFVGGQNGG